MSHETVKKSGSQPSKTSASRQRGESRLEDKLLVQIVEADLPVPIRQSRAPWDGTGRLFKADFYWPEFGLIVEVDGGTWSGGRHTRGEGYERDCEKLALAAINGQRILKVTSRQVQSGVALQWIGAMLGVWESTAGHRKKVSAARKPSDKRKNVKPIH